LAAFTLIEVLMSIFVLALGLLGLGAVIPGIIREQRVASDRTLGIVVANDAKAYLSARADLGRLGIPPSGGSGTGLGSTAGRSYGLGVWLRNDEWSPTYAWDTNSIDVNDYEDIGNVLIGTTVSVGGSVGRVEPVRIPLSDRLYPSPASNLDAPQFVWDFVARRLPPTEADGYPMLADSGLGLLPGTPEPWRTGVEIAVFVRRVDTGIRVGPNQTGYGVMLRGTNPILPVGLDEAGAPTGAGADTSQSHIYAPPITLRAEYDGTRNTVLRLEADTTLSGAEPGSGVTLGNRLLLASQVGQQLVDNLGNVYTVDERIDTGPGTSFVEVRVRPSIPSWVPATSGTVSSWDDEDGWTQVRQVVFVPQPPASAIVFRLGVDPNAVRSPSGSGAGRLPL
jgi:type II secretory pathway pseudopilin PulG